MTKILTNPPKGTRDFLPEDVLRREHVTRIIRNVYEAHGFLPLETPSFERLETLLGKYGDEGDQLVFKILHRGQPLVEGIREAGRRIADPTSGTIVMGRSGETAPAAETLLADMGLRFDLTVPLARVVAEYQGKLPSIFKRYQIQPVWRADTPGKGRFREFYQCDVDVVGSSSLVVEAEVAGAVAECMARLGFKDFEIRLNHRKLLRALIDWAGIDPSLEGEAIVAIDKLGKVGEEGVLAEMTAKGVPEQPALDLLRLLRDERDLDSLTVRLKDDAVAQQALQELAALLELSKLTPAASRIRFDPMLARGLGYYTGCIFEIAVADLAGSLGGGGRYDGLIGMFLGKDVPACGFSIGLERILVVMEQRKMFPAALGRGLDVLVAATDASRMADAIALAYELRARGLNVDVAPREEKAGKIRKSADDRGIACAAILHRDEPDVVNVWSRSLPNVTDSFLARAEVVEKIVASRLTAAND